MEVEGTHVTSLPTLISPQSTDLMYIYDNTLGKSKKVTLDTLRNLLAHNPPVPPPVIPPAQDLQSVMDEGGIATVSTSEVTIEVENDIAVYASNDGAGTESVLYLETGSEASLTYIESGSGSVGLTMDFNGGTLTDSLSEFGFKYALDYSLLGTADPRWIPDYGTVTALPISTFTNDTGYITSYTETDPIFLAHAASNVIDSGGGTLFLSDAGTYVAAGADGNGIFTGSDTVPTSVVATITDTLTFTGGDLKLQGLTNSTLFVTDHSADRVFVGALVGTAVFNVDNGTGTGFTTSISRNFDAGVGQNGHLFTVNPRGSEVRRVRTNGTAFSIWNEWTIGDNRKSFDFIASVNNNYFSIFDSGTGLVEKVRIGDEISWWNGNGSTSYGFGFGHSSPLGGTVHSKSMDWKVESVADVNLINLDYSTNLIAFGSATYANTKFSVTNSTTETTIATFLNAATNIEFTIKEDGTTYYSGRMTISGTLLAGDKFRVAGGDSIFEDSSGTGLVSVMYDERRVGINTSSPNASAILDIVSTDKGVLLPRMTHTQAGTITGVNGLVIYVTSTDATFTAVGFWGYEGGAWTKL